MESRFSVPLLSCFTCDADCPNTESHWFRYSREKSHGCGAAREHLKRGFGRGGCYFYFLVYVYLANRIGIEQPISGRYQLSTALSQQRFSGLSILVCVNFVCSGEAIEVLSLPLDQSDAFIKDTTISKSAGVCFGLLWLKERIATRQRDLVFNTQSMS